MVASLATLCLSICWWVGHRCLPEEQQNLLKTSISEYFRSGRNPIPFCTGRMMYFGRCLTWRRKQPAPQKHLSSSQHSWHCHSSSGMFKDPAAMFWQLSVKDFAVLIWEIHGGSSELWLLWSSFFSGMWIIKLTNESKVLDWVGVARRVFWGGCRVGGYRGGF